MSVDSDTLSILRSIELAIQQQPRTPVWRRPDIIISLIVFVLPLIATVSMAWGSFDTKLAEHDVRIINIETEHKSHMDQYAQTREIIVKLTVTLEEMSKNLTLIRTKLDAHNDKS